MWLGITLARPCYHSVPTSPRSQPSQLPPRTGTVIQWWTSPSSQGAGGRPHSPFSCDHRGSVNLEEGIHKSCTRTRCLISRNPEHREKQQSLTLLLNYSLNQVKKSPQKASFSLICSFSSRVRSNWLCYRFVKHPGQPLEDLGLSNRLLDYFDKADNFRGILPYRIIVYH